MNIKKVVRRGLAAVGVLLALAIVGVVVKFYVLSPSSRPAPNVSALSTPEAIERGRYLANHVMLCMDCHSSQKRTAAGLPTEEGLGAGAEFYISDFPGKVRSPNITPDKETGIGAWSDGEILRALREGVSRDGRALFPMMPWPNFAITMSDDDGLAIIAYIRTLKPVKNDPGRMEIKLPLSVIYRSFPEPLAKSPPPPPPASDKKAHGEWLLKAALCSTCHNTFDSQHQTIPGMRFAGGTKWDLPDGKGHITVPNITSDKATGIGSYTDHDVQRVLEQGVAKSGEPLVSRGLGLPWEMPWPFYKGMTNEDKEALIFALREVPAAQHIVAPSVVKK